ncbi:hypothetical protein RSJ42_07300 [Methanosarcina hadiensis]|uniref:hypothetical protein n=1 Tax=Methanosarcina hadiensis TaxID=3078083 RepID=UPI0039774FFC
MSYAPSYLLWVNGFDRKNTLKRLIKPGIIELNKPGIIELNKSGIIKLIEHGIIKLNKHGICDHKN